MTEVSRKSENVMPVDAAAIDWAADLERRYRVFEAGVRVYLPDADLSLLREAWLFAVERHEGQTRQSGEPYVAHPLAVADIVADLRLGVPSLCAALLHDVVEDTDTPIEEIRTRFGDLVAFFVEGLTKLSRIEFQSKEEHQAENLRKLILAMTRDLRVVIIKLADRLHNIRTLDACPVDKQRRIAQETLEIYAPLAGRLGINWLKSELEDQSLKYLDPEAYQNLKQLIHRKRSEREVYIEETSAVMQAMLDEAAIEGEVSGRPKHFYSMYRKMKRSGISFDEIYDITAFRIIVEDKATCYNVLGLVHDRWRPVAGRFKDYIAVPKGNGYQSLHTTVIGPKGERVEIQIRTKDMHQTAEFGVAAHWVYKEGRETDTQNLHAFQWMRTLLESQAEIDDSIEYLESVKLDLFEDEIFVFTPAGDVKALPRGSTPLDFAYAVHSEVGHHAAHARVNGRHVSLRQQLQTGDMVEIITREDQHPREEWLEIAKSSRARARIRAYIGQAKREKARELGEELLSAEIRKYDLKFSSVQRDGKLLKCAEALKLNSVDQLLVDIGYGRLQADAVARTMAPAGALTQKADTGKPERRFGEFLQERTAAELENRVAYVVGLKGDVMTSFARCCNPVPGEEITGYVTRGRGVVIHISTCDRLSHLEPERLIEVEWALDAAGGERDQPRSVRLRVIARDAQGILANIASTLSDRQLNITEARARSRSNGTAIVTFAVDVENANQLHDALRHVGRVPGVVSVDRM